MANRHHQPKVPMSDSNDDDNPDSDENEPRTEADVYTARLEDFESPSIAVVSVVSDVVGADRSTAPVLYDVVDPDALDQLFHRRHARSTELFVSFRYLDCMVTVRSTGEVTVRPT